MEEHLGGLQNVDEDFADEGVHQFGNWRASWRDLMFMHDTEALFETANVLLNDACIVDCRTVNCISFTGVSFKNILLA